MCVRSCLKRTAIQSPTLGDSMAKIRRFAGRCYRYVQFDNLQGTIYLGIEAFTIYLDIEVFTI